MRVLLGNDNICIINVNNTFSRWWMISLIMFLSFIKFTARAAEYYSRKKQTQSITPHITVNIFTHSTGTLVKRQADGEKAAIRVQQKHCAFSRHKLSALYLQFCSPPDNFK